MNEPGGALSLLLPELPVLPALPIDATLPPGEGPGLGDEGDGVPVLLEK